MIITMVEVVAEVMAVVGIDPVLAHLVLVALEPRPPILLPAMASVAVVDLVHIQMNRRMINPAVDHARDRPPSMATTPRPLPNEMVAVVAPVRDHAPTMVMPNPRVDHCQDQGNVLHDLI